MVRAIDRQGSIQKTKSFHKKRMFEIQGQKSHSIFVENGNEATPVDDMVRPRPRPDAGTGGAIRKSPRSDAGAAIRKSPRELKSCLTSVQYSICFWRTEEIGAYAPRDKNKIMTTRQRRDLLMNIPALRKLDALLIEQLDQFGGQNEFWYVSTNSEESEQETPPRNDDRWWIPTVKVPPQGLSDTTRRWLNFQKDSVNQVLKAAMAINAQVLSEMEVPENYTESLPKNGKASLGDSVYKSITLEYFDPEQFLSYMDLSTEHKVLDLKNRIEASIVIWKRKMNQKDGKSSWSTGVRLEKRELFEERAETILIILKQRFPGIPQSALDISKIQYNKDVGQAILESYSRIIESLAFNIISRIEDVLYSDSLTQTPKSDVDERFENKDQMDRPSFAETPTSAMTLRFHGMAAG